MGSSRNFGLCRWVEVHSRKSFLWKLWLRVVYLIQETFIVKLLVAALSVPKCLPKTHGHFFVCYLLSDQIMPLNYRQLNDEWIVFAAYKVKQLCHILFRYSVFRPIKSWWKVSRMRQNKLSTTISKRNFPRMDYNPPTETTVPATLHLQKVLDYCFIVPGRWLGAASGSWLYQMTLIHVVVQLCCDSPPTGDNMNCSNGAWTLDL